MKAESLIPRLACIALVLFFGILQLSKIYDSESHHNTSSPNYQPYVVNNSGERNLDKEKFELKIKIFTCNRAKSLERLLKSLQEATYSGDKVDLDIYVDSPNNIIDRKAVLDADKKTVKSSILMKEKVLAICKNFQWVHGRKAIHERVFNVGVLGQWIESWYPSHPNEYALMLEDDIEVSPFFYYWIKNAATHYNKPGNSSLGNIFGVTMQKLTKVFSIDKHKGTLPPSTKGNPFAYPILGTWGQLFFPGPWNHFRDWFRNAYSNPDFQPLVPEVINTEWYLKLGNKAWEQWVIKWARDFKLYCVYSNPPGKLCLSTNHREPGNNYNEHVGPDCQLIRHDIPALKKFPETPTFFGYSLFEEIVDTDNRRQGD